jgi:hypothetical protein
MKSCIFVIIALSFFSCSTLYYGYLPGTDYKYYKPTQKYDLKKRAMNIIITDKRLYHYNIQCSDLRLDRNTELEENMGFQYFKNNLFSVIDSCNGIIDSTAKDTIHVYLEGLSFELIGFGYIVAHGLVQFSVKSSKINKTYCSDMKDSDPDAPLKWYSFVTRKTGSRLIVSGSLRRAIEDFLKDM